MTTGPPDPETAYWWPRQHISDAELREVAEVARWVARDYGRFTDADDIAQVVLLRLVTRLPRNDPIRDFRAFARKTAKNVTLDLLRSSRTGSQFADLSAEDHAHLLAAEPHRHFELYVEDLLRVLTPSEAKVVRARYVLDMDLNSTADYLGVTTNTVKTLLKRALRRLRETFSEQELRALILHESVGE